MDTPQICVKASASPPPHTLLTFLCLTQCKLLSPYFPLDTCSGCVTSAESVLISQQSQEEVYRVAEENKKLKQVFVVFCPPVSRIHYETHNKTDERASVPLDQVFFFLSSILCTPKICLSVCLSTCLSVCLSVCLSTCLSVCRSVCPLVCLSVCLSTCLSVWQEGRGGEGKVIVVSISPQARASIAAKFNLTVQQVYSKPMWSTHWTSHLRIVCIDNRRQKSWWLFSKTSELTTSLIWLLPEISLSLKGNVLKTPPEMRTPLQ